MMALKKYFLFKCILLFSSFTQASDISEDIRSQIPSHALAILGFQSPRPENLTEAYQGPNCFTGLRYWYHPTQPLVFVDTEDLRSWIEENFRALTQGESPQFGDIIIFYRKEIDHWKHGAIFLNEYYVWNKLGPDRLLFDINTEKLSFTQPAWTITPMSELLETYDTSDILYFRKK